MSFTDDYFVCITHVHTHPMPPLGTGQKVQGGGWAGAFRNVVDRKHMTHPFQLEQNGVTHPLMKAENDMTHPPIRHGIFGSIIRKKSNFVDEIVVLFTF